MTSSLTLVLLLSGVAVCIATGVPGGFSEHDHHSDPKFLELAHFATKTWSSQQPGKTHFDTVSELLKAESQVVAGTNYRLTLKVAESVCELTATYTKEACTPKPDAVPRTCTAVINESLQRTRSVFRFDCVAA